MYLNLHSVLAKFLFGYLQGMGVDGDVGVLVSSDRLQYGAVHYIQVSGQSVVTFVVVPSYEVGQVIFNGRSESTISVKNHLLTTYKLCRKYKE